MNAPTGILVCSVNWLGDACMSLPALARFRERHPDIPITVLTKPHLRSFWHMAPMVNRLVDLKPGLPGLLEARQRLASEPCAQAIILPNSWRSALAPWLARIPRRIGARRGLRNLLITECVDAPAFHDQALHQQLEIDALLGNPPHSNPLAGDCLLMLPDDARATAERWLPDSGAPWIGMLPGAARGPSKQWPPERFAETAQRLQSEDGLRVCLFGTSSEKAVCDHIAATAASGTLLNLAGQTTLPQLAAALGRCRCVVCNDSGGMHLAAVRGTPVAAIFGLTDPAKTGPIGTGHRILMAPGIQRERDIARRSDAASAALAAVSTGAVISAVRGILGIRVELG